MPLPVSLFLWIEKRNFIRIILTTAFFSKTDAFQKVLKIYILFKKLHHHLEGIPWRKALWVLWMHAPSMHTSPSFSAQISPAWGRLHWRRGFQMSTWKGKRTPECWSTSGFRYSHVDQKHAWGISRNEPPDVLPMSVWDTQWKLALCCHEYSLDWRAKYHQVHKGWKKSFLLRQPITQSKA